MTTQPLTLQPRRRGAPPRHLADLDMAARKEAVVELGLPAFRARQLSHHYFGRQLSDVSAMSDLPAADRERLGGELFPSLLTPVTQVACDDGATRKTVWRLHDGSLVESVLMGDRKSVV